MTLMCPFDFQCVREKGHIPNYITGMGSQAYTCKSKGTPAGVIVAFVSLPHEPVMCRD